MSRPVIAVVDYHKGNLMSVERGLHFIGADAIITDDPSVISKAQGVVVPGVGAFADASASMRVLGQVDALRSCVDRGTPFLGICLGMHLMFAEGVEGVGVGDIAQGLGFLPGVVTALPARDSRGRTFKVPHIGWNAIDFDDGAAPAILKGIPSGEYFYFTHSYRSPDGPGTVATTVHSSTFPSVIAYRETAFGVQFHPEKSSDAGLALLDNFHSIVKGS